MAGAHTRTAAIQAAFIPFLRMFSEEHRKLFKELIFLAEWGERAQELFTQIQGTPPRGRRSSHTAALEEHLRSPSTKESKKGSKAARSSKLNGASSSYPSRKNKKRDKVKGAFKAKKGLLQAKNGSSATPSSKGKGTARKTTTAKARSNGALPKRLQTPSLREMVLPILKDSTGPMRVGEIAERVKEAGYRPTNPRFAKRLASLLGTLGEVERVEKGSYQLKR